MRAFKLDPDASPAGAWWVGEICLVPRRLVEVFGQPRGTDDYKKSGRFLFSDQFGNLFEVHDWKQTTLYHDERRSGYPTPRAFWRKTEPVTLRFRATDKNRQAEIDADAIAEFVQWVIQQVS